MWKKRLLSLLKFAFAFGIIAFLLKSGKLSLEELGTFLKSPLALFSTAFFVFSTFLLSFYRWKTLLLGQGIKMSYWSCFRLGMLGQFFSAVIPGTVGGDLVKGVFVARRFPGKKAASVSTIILDRVLGLVGMVILGGIAFLFGLPKILTLSGDGAVMVLWLGWALTILALCFVFGLAAFSLLGKKLPKQAPAFIQSIPAIGSKLAQLYLIALDYQRCPRYLWQAVGISIISHCCNMGAMFVVTYAVHGPQPWGDLGGLSLVVSSIMGLCAMAIPVAPMGLGVGQLAFGRIFYAFGAPTANFGIPIVTGFQVIMLLLNLSGSVFFATYKHEVHESGLATS